MFAVAAAILVSRWRWRAPGGDPELVYEVAMWGFPAGLIGGRIYFLITTPSQVPDHWWGPFAIWQGGLGIWGGIAGGARGRAVGAAAGGSAAHDLRRFMDVAAPGAAGRPGDRPDRQLLQPGAVRQADARCPGRLKIDPRRTGRPGSGSTPPSSPRSCTR